MVKAAHPFPSVFPWLPWCGKQHGVPHGFALCAYCVGNIFLIRESVLTNFIFGLSGVFKSDQQLAQELQT